MLGAPSVAVGQTLPGSVVGALAPIGQPGLTQVSRPALAPSHAIQPSLLSQRLVLTSQAQARLPSKWPPLPSSPPLSITLNLWHNSKGFSTLRPSLGALLICVQSVFSQRTGSACGLQFKTIKHCWCSSALIQLFFYVRKIQHKIKTQKSRWFSICSHISSISTASAFFSFFSKPAWTLWMTHLSYSTQDYTTKLLFPPCLFNHFFLPSY